MRSGSVLQFFALLGTLGSGAEARPPVQDVLGGHTSTVPTAGRRRLNGKFLHITDIHPDPFYKVYSSTDDVHACHRGRGPAGFYGAETSDCDTPISLVNATFDWIEKNLKDEIDFIVWTGDSAKHDNDERIPRTQDQVIEQNQLITEKFLEVFGTYKGELSIPIIPTLGNNDVLPHNIFKEGPNKWTKEYLDIWKPFIPANQRKQFKKGGWFSVEVIPDRLAVISLNTLYFFDSNSAVNGCVAKSEPGYEHFEWLRKQLDHLRARGMKVMLMGHVPPARVDSRADWVESCWQKYTLWQQKYRDVIVGSFYGHMNIDHFMLQDFKNIKKSVKKGYATLEASEAKQEEGELDIMNAKDYLNDLRSYFAKIPSFKINEHDDEDVYEEEEHSSWFEDMLWMLKKGSKKHKKNGPLAKIGGEYGERYSLAFVAPSVVPNYFPTLRVFEYNTTGLPEYVSDPDATDMSTNQVPAHTPPFEDLFVDLEEELSYLRADLDGELVKKRHHFKVPKAPSKVTPPGPAYSPQTLSLMGYKQYFANLTHINNDFANALVADVEDGVDAERWKPGKHHGKVKKGKPHPRKFNFHVEYDTTKDKKYGLKDLTVRSYIDLARSIGKTAKKGESSKVWHTFIRRAFVGSVDPEELEKQFGGWNATASEADEGGAAALEL